MSAPLSPPLPLTPLSQTQADLLRRLTSNMDERALWWLSGYAAGLASASQESLHALPAAPIGALSLRATVLFGSQTGNAKRIAEALSRQIEATGVQVRLLSTGDYNTAELKDEKLLYLVISTQGEGDPPDDALGFVEFVEGRRAPKLEQLKFAVLGLGDSSYPKFCEVGKRLDTRFTELGATRLVDRADADVDIEAIALPWQARCVEAAKALHDQTSATANVTPLRPRQNVANTSTKRWTRENPFAAELLTNQRITAGDSDKDIRHIELLLDDDVSLHYEPGDALGVWPTNPPVLVEAVLHKLGLDGDTALDIAGESAPLRTWLSDKRELTRLTRPFLQAHAARAGSTVLDDLLASTDTEAVRQLLQDQQLIDVLKTYHANWTAPELVAALRPLTPRLYSIASSHKVNEGEVHLTVAHVAYQNEGEPRWGTASHFLASQSPGTKLKVFIEDNERFRLPRDSDRDVIMIGPGTGVAPFRAFVQERTATGARGRNWLFFGNPHFRKDFLYQLEWQRALKQGQLQRIDLAFSRDQVSKVYVQDRIREHGQELYQWIENGAYVYVCGDANKMARDVHAALIEIIQTHGGKSHDEAQTRIKELQQHGRYARDVY